MQWVLLGLNLVLASCALWAAITARSCLRALRLKLAERSTRSLRELESWVSGLDAACAANSTTLRRLSSRIGMQDVRARQKAESEPANMTPAERKAWLRRKLQSGELKVHRDNPAEGN